MMKLLLSVFTLFWLLGAHAEEAMEIDKRVSLRTIEPARDVGYTVGDKLSRTVILEVDKPYALLPTSLPIAGAQKKRRNQDQGIELREITVKESAGISTTTYTLHLTYQVFTNRQVARPAALPPEFVKFGGKGENFEVRIPSWNFRISPLAVFGAVNIEKDMSGYRGPLLLDATPYQQRMWGLLALSGIALLGLFYVVGTANWLPRMGRPFARAYRDIRKLPSTPEGIAKATERLHQALNATAGGSIFDSAGFVTAHPGFAPVAPELDRFFSLSRTVFFEPDATHGIDDPLPWLQQLCRRCRDCERGLK